MGLFSFLGLGRDRTPTAVVPVTPNLNNYIYADDALSLNLFEGITDLIATEFAKIQVGFSEKTPSRRSLEYLLRVSPNSSQSPDELLYTFARSLLDTGHVYYKITQPAGAGVQSIEVSKSLKAGFKSLDATRLRLRKPRNLIDQYAKLLNTLSTSHSGNTLELNTMLRGNASIEEQKELLNERLAAIEFQQKQYGAFTTVNGEKITQHPQAVAPDGTALNDLRALIAQELHINASMLDGSYTESEYRAFYQTHVAPLASEFQAWINREIINRDAYLSGSRCIVNMDFTKVATISDFTAMAKDSLYSGYMTADEVRELLGRDPYPDGLGSVIFTNKNAIALSELPDSAAGQGFAADDTNTKEDAQNV